MSFDMILRQRPVGAAQAPTTAIDGYRRLADDNRTVHAAQTQPQWTEPALRRRFLVGSLVVVLFEAIGTGLLRGIIGCLGDAWYGSAVAASVGSDSLAIADTRHVSRRGAK